MYKHLDRLYTDMPYIYMVNYKNWYIIIIMIECTFEIYYDRYLFIMFVFIIYICNLTNKINI